MDQEYLKDDARPERPVKALKKLSPVEKLILRDQRLNVKALLKIIKLSETTAHRILYDHLGIQKVNIK